MPKRAKKPREERIAEEYFPIDKGDIKYTTEKRERKPFQSITKSIEISTKSSPLEREVTKRAIEKKYKKQFKEPLEIVKKISKKSYKKSPKKTSKKTTIKTKEYSSPKITLKKEGYELIITEKPQAAAKIATALGKPVQKTAQKVSYYELIKNNKKIVVACAVGHLFTLKQKKLGSEIPTFDIGWVPNYLSRKNDFTKRYHDVLLKIAKNASSLTVATDYDIEGEVIGLNVVRFICGQKDANRMKFSTLTEKELNEAYDKKSQHISWGQAIAGETRHYLDWFYGINLSRALMNSIKTTGKFRIMSIGRVQGPALNLIVKKEREIQEFKPVSYWQIFITIDDGKNKLELKHNKDIFEKSELEKFKDLKGKKVDVETRKTEQIFPPNPPFNLTTLQTEAYKFYGITPSETLRIAQSLYLSGLISYPRTSSQKLPESIDYKSILKKLSKKYHTEKLTIREKPVQGKKSDPAHPSIYPTGNAQILTGKEEKIYELIVKRFLSLFCEDAIVDSKTIRATTNKLIFSTRGSSIRKKAWMEIYPSKLKEKEIPDIKKEAKIIDSKIEEKKTSPPNRYSPASIISELEKRNLGTKATRSSILETLYDRGYIKEKSIEATPLGMSLIESLEKYSPIIIDEKLTRSFEQRMDSIQEAKKGFEEKEKEIIEKAKETITTIINQFKKNEKEIGKELLKANVELREQQKIENKLNLCPVCKKGHLSVTYSKKTRRHFVACNAYPNCRNTYSLPPNGVIKKTGKTCEKCSFPILMLLKSGKKPWFFCFNPECPTNKKRIEEYRKNNQN
ncbi:MAG: DNA topoisomerase I [Nanoarchaeota archaeon]|nr:DNA topoisomerase I [Nanoarchaeota archaeon]